MKNELYEEFAKEKFNQDNNYQAIISKVKEGYTMKKNKSKKYKILNIAAVFVVAIITGIFAQNIYAKIQWDIKFKEYQYRPVEEAKGSLEEAKESGYAQVINMDYITQDGISAKVDSMLLTDDCFDANVSFKFDESVVLDSEKFTFGYAVYDQNKNIYQISGRIHMDSPEKYATITPFIYRELGVDYNKKDIYAIQLSDRGGLGNIEASEENRTITTNITIRARDSFPKSKKIYIRLFDLGYTMLDVDLENSDPEKRITNAEDFQLSKAEWIFEIDVPDKFQERQTLELKLQDEIPDLEIEKITLTEAGMVLRFKSEGYRNLISAGKDMKGNEFSEARANYLSITDGEGKVYQDLGGGTTQNGGYKMILDAGKKDLDKKLYINFNSDGKQYTSELVVK